MRRITLPRPAAVVRWLVVGWFGFVGSAFAGPKIGVLFKDKSPGFWIYAENGASEAAKTLGAEVIIKAPPTASYRVGEKVRAAVDMERVHLFDAQSEQAIARR